MTGASTSFGDEPYHLNFTFFFCENKGFMNGYFHVWVARKTSSWVFYYNIFTDEKK